LVAHGEWKNNETFLLGMKWALCEFSGVVSFRIIATKKEPPGPRVQKDSRKGDWWRDKFGLASRRFQMGSEVT